MIVGNVTLSHKGEEFTTTDLWGQDWEEGDKVEYDGVTCTIVAIEEADEYDPDPDWEDLIDGVGFADPGGNSSLRAATADNPREHPCPTCHYPNRLTGLDVRSGLQCDSCANAAERGMDGPRNPDCEADECPLCLVVEPEED